MLYPAALAFTHFPFGQIQKNEKPQLDVTSDQQKLIKRHILYPQRTRMLNLSN